MWGIQLVFKYKGAGLAVTKDRKRILAALEIDRGEQTDLFRLSGALTVFSVGSINRSIEAYFQHTHSPSIQVDGGGIETCDTAGIALLARIRRLAEQHDSHVEFTNLRQPQERLLKAAFQTGPAESSPVESSGALAQLGRKAAEFAADIREEIIFAGHLFTAFVYVLFHPRQLRYRDFWRTCERAGVDGTPIILLLGLLFGLILSFSSAMPMKQFGVEIYVADLVAYATVRVLGPFITAVILAGRTGSSFAAEIGTMKINNEIDALEVMALDPVRFLVVPRFLATVLMTPLLVVLMNLSGLIGAGLVIRSMGYPLVTYWNHVQGILSATDVLVGLGKSVVFGALVAGIGTLRGLQTGLGSGAVGLSTTRAVVSAIIALVAAEGMFSVLLYFLEI